jgi:hypothetical protein
MSQVTGGLVSVEDGIKKSEEYAPPRKVRVELSFGVEEGGDFEAIFDRVSQAATNRVASLLNGTALNVVQAETPASGETTRRPRRTKEQIAADKAAAEGGPSPSGSAGGAQTSAKDPASVEEDPTGGEESVVHLPDESAKDPAAIEDDAAPEEVSFDIEPEEEAGEEVSDTELNSRVQRRNADLEDPDLIRDLIKKFNPDPKKSFTLRQIPQAQRADFLKQLDSLKKAG